MSLIDPDSVTPVPLSFMNADHGVECRLLNELGDVLSAHCDGVEDASAVVEALARLYVSMQEHFAREEVLMQQERVPDGEAHRLEHRRLLRSIEEEALRFRVAGDAGALSAYVSRLPERWIDHVEQMDLPAARDVVAGRG